MVVVRSEVLLVSLVSVYVFMGEIADREGGRSGQMAEGGFVDHRLLQSCLR